MLKSIKKWANKPWTNKTMLKWTGLCAIMSGIFSLLSWIWWKGYMKGARDCEDMEKDK